MANLDSSLTIVVSNYLGGRLAPKRREYLQQSIESLTAETKRDIIIVDDGSPETELTFLHNLTKHHSNIQIKHYENNVGIERLVDEYAKLCSSRFLYITDNDMLYKIGFDRGLAEAIDLIDNHHPGTAVVSLFNTIKNHPVVMDSINPNFVVKRSCGGASILVERNVFAAACPWIHANGFTDPTQPLFTDENHPLFTDIGKRRRSWDWGFSHYIIMNHIPILTRRQSLVRHIGGWGLHSQESNGWVDNGEE